MKNFIIFIIVLELVTPRIFGYVQTPISKIKLPKRIPDVSYQGSIFSYTANGHDSMKSIRDYALETDDIKLLEEKFIDHFTETILSKFANEMKSGIPTMAIPPLDPLRLNEIQVEPHIGSEIFTINLNNVEIEGLSDMEIQDLKPKLNALKVRLALIFPKVTANCHFKVNGTLYNVIDVRGEGQAKLEYSDVYVRTQLNLIHENRTFRVSNSDPPLVDFNSAKILLSDYQNKTSKVGLASEFGPLLFWVFADHVVQEIDQYLLKYVNANMRLFKVPESFNPAITWLMNKSFSGGNHGIGGIGGIGLIGQSSQKVPQMLSPFPLLHHWINSLSQMKPAINVQTRLFK